MLIEHDQSRDAVPAGDGAYELSLRRISNPPSAQRPTTQPPPARSGDMLWVLVNSKEILFNH